MLTGGSGMVGRNFQEYSRTAEFEILAPSSRELDLTDFKAVESFLHSHKPDIVIHAAGRVGGIQANLREPVRFLMENLDLGRNIVWAARSVGIKRLLNLGSSCMYPRDCAIAFSEDMVLKGELEPTNEGYALAKIITARLCAYISRETPEYQYKTLISSNLYGRHDHFDPARSHLVPAIIRKIHQAKESGSPSVEIWSDGKARREFMYAGDLAECLVQAIRNFETLPEMMNVGTGRDYSVDEYYQLAAEVIGYSGHFRHEITKPAGTMRKLVSTKRAEEWGWRAKTNLRDGIAHTYDFYRQNVEKTDVKVTR